MNIEVKPLSLTTIDGFLNFFDNIGFTDNPEWSGCYCYYYKCQDNNNEWIRRSGEENRKDVIDLIKSNKMHGFIAFLDNKPIGWCHADSKDNFPRLMIRSDLISDLNKKIISIVCFLIAPSYRKKGIARELLKSIIFQSKQMGYNLLEAYPVKNANNDAKSYHGPINLYKSEGFTIYKELEDLYILHKAL